MGLKRLHLSLMELFTVAKPFSTEIRAANEDVNGSLDVAQWLITRLITVGSADPFFYCLSTLPVICP